MLSVPSLAIYVVYEGVNWDKIFGILTLAAFVGFGLIGISDEIQESENKKAEEKLTLKEFIVGVLFLIAAAIPAIGFVVWLTSEYEASPWVLFGGIALGASVVGTAFVLFAVLSKAGPEVSTMPFRESKAYEELLVSGFTGVLLFVLAAVLYFYSGESPWVLIFGIVALEGSLLMPLFFDDASVAASHESTVTTTWSCPHCQKNLKTFHVPRKKGSTFNCAWCKERIQS